MKYDMFDYESVDYLKSLVKQLKFDQDYLLLSLNQAIKDGNETEKEKYINELKEIHKELEICIQYIEKFNE